jgi:hypothetical protein
MKPKNTMDSQDAFLEQKKNTFLTALYENDYKAVENIYLDILKHAQSLSKFNENDEKLFNQIQTIYKKFKPVISKHCSPIIEQSNTQLKKIIVNNIKITSKNAHHVDFKTWDDRLGLNSLQKDLLYKTVMTFQITSGCSNFCRRCNEWAIPKVRSHFTYSAILKILKQMARQKNHEISLYGASDPLDWEQDEKNIFDIIEFIKTLPMEYNILTKVPKGKENLLKTLLEINSNLSVSITSKNKARLTKLEQEIKKTISKQHDLDELLIPAGLDEDFASVKPSITDGYGTEITPDGAFIIIPAFTSALHPFGHKKIQITSRTSFFPAKKTGRTALLSDYFKPLEGFNLEKKHCYLTYLLDVQIESIILDSGEYNLTPPGMRSTKEYLSIFDKKARLQRKSMTPSVLKKIKKQFLINTSYKNLSSNNKCLYLKKISTHLNHCKKNVCQLSKLNAVSYFLESISYYIKKNPIKIKIMQFLLKDEMEKILDSYMNIVSKKSFEETLSDPDIDSFDVFRFYIFTLLNKTNNKSITQFIKTYSSAYDPVADLFVPYSSMLETSACNEMLE